MMIVAEISSENWQQGLTWLRNGKSKNLHLYVIDRGLGKKQLDYIANLGFDVGTPDALILPRPFDVWDDLSYWSGDHIAYAPPEASVSDSHGEKMTAEASAELDPDRLVVCVDSIERRVYYAKQLAEAKEKDGALLSSSYICGRPQDWANLSGFARMLLETRIIDPLPQAADLVLNLYAQTYKDSVARH